MRFNKIDFLIRNNFVAFNSLNFNALEKNTVSLLSVLLFEIGIKNQPTQFEKEKKNFKINWTLYYLLK